MASRGDAADTLLRWHLQGHGREAEAAVASHPEETLDRVVAHLEREHPGWAVPSPREAAGRAPGPQDALFGSEPPDPVVLGDALDRMRPWLSTARADEISERLAEGRIRPDRRTLQEVRRTLGVLSLEVDLRRELTGPRSAAGPSAVLLFRRDGRALATVGEATSPDPAELARVLRRGLSSREKAAYAASLQDDRVLVVRGDRIVAAAVFPEAPGRDAVSLLVRAVDKIEASAASGAISPATAIRFAETIARLLSRPSL